MKFLKLFYPWLILIILVGIVLYWLFIGQKKSSDKLSVCGKVEYIKKTRGSYCQVEISENRLTRYMAYSYKENEPDIFVGDSVFKRGDSKILYIKSLKDSITRIAKYQNYLLGE